MVRYDDMRVDRLLVKEYKQQIEIALKSVSGLNDIELSLKAFEKEFASYIGVRHALSVNSGTDALQLALLALGVGNRDSVLIPNLTYPAVPLSVIYVGAKPILVDAAEDLQIDTAQLEKKLSKNTKAIIAAHMFARPCAIEKIMDFAKGHGLKVIEDCCQAESSSLHERKLGSFADISCFSFSYYKPLSSCGGGGGMVCFNDQALSSLLQYTRMGVDSQEQLAAGQRFPRMNFMDLIMVKAKWRYLKEIIKSRNKIKSLYEKGLDNLPDIRIFHDDPEAVSVAQNYVICLRKRDVLGEILIQEGVIWQKPYTPLNRMSIFSPFSAGDYPQSDIYFKQAIHLPLYSFMKPEEAEKVINIIINFIKK